MINNEPFYLSFQKTPHKAKNKHEIRIFLRSGVGATAVDRSIYFAWLWEGRTMEMTYKCSK